MQVQHFEEKFRRSIQKSRPYFEEKQICQDQLRTQKDRIHMLQQQIQMAKATYSRSLKLLEQISEEIHRKRGDYGSVAPPGPREPGVGAELTTNIETEKTKSPISMNNAYPLPDFNALLDKCEIRSVGTSVTTSSAVSEKGDDDSDNEDDLDLEELRLKVRNLAIRPVEGGDGQQEQDVWENELNATVNKLDQLMMLRESSSINNLTNSLPSTPVKTASSPIKMLKMADPLPLLNVSMHVLPLHNHGQNNLNNFNENCNSSSNTSSNINNNRNKMFNKNQKRRKLSE